MKVWNNMTANNDNFFIFITLLNTNETIKSVQGDSYAPLERFHRLRLNLTLFFNVYIYQVYSYFLFPI